ncbi:hypothetical protein BCD48_41830 [Pseudofrankia sp. BMG5.36]|nr:hypothetical protein BCD48_41830 [Pseudofrankia sp. BMG5.36]
MPTRATAGASPHGRPFRAAGQYLSTDRAGLAVDEDHDAGLGMRQLGELSGPVCPDGRGGVLTVSSPPAVHCSRAGFPAASDQAADRGDEPAPAAMPNPWSTGSMRLSGAARGRPAYVADL